MPDASVQLSLNHAGANGIDANPERGEVFGHALAKVDDRCFCRAVGWVSLGSNLSSDGSQQSETAEVFLLQNGVACVGHVDDAHDVDVEHATPVLGPHVPERKAKPARTDTGRNHDMSQVAPFVVDRLKRGMGCRLIGDVCDPAFASWRVGFGCPTLLPNFFRGFWCCRIKIDEGHVAAFTIKFFRDGESDTIAATNNRHILAMQVKIHDHSFLGCVYLCGAEEIVRRSRR